MASPRVGIRPYLRSLAGWVWNRQNEAKRHGLSLQEETLTEMLLLRIATDCKPLGLHTRMFTRQQEAVNGSDWEWFVRGPHCSVAYRVQAKRLYHAGRFQGQYGGHDPQGPQTSRLIQMAGSANPIYLFYNHSSTDAFDGMHSPGFRGPSHWGCSFASAFSVEEIGSRDPLDLLDRMRPWHEMFDECLRAAEHISLDSPRRGEPAWLKMLDDPEALEVHMEKRELVGVALFDASHAEMNWEDA